MKKESVFRIIEACVLLVIGVLFCVSLAMGTEALSIILGASLIAAGAVIVILSLANEKSVFTPISLGGLLAIALGVAFIVGNVVAFIFSIIPYILLVFGSALFIEAFLGYFLRKEKLLAAFIIKLVLGVVLIVVGVLLLTVADFKNYVALIVGIALIILAIANIALEFYKAKN